MIHFIWRQITLKKCAYAAVKWVYLMHLILEPLSCNLKELWGRRGRDKEDCWLKQLVCNDGLNTWVLPSSEIFLQVLQSFTAPSWGLFFSPHRGHSQMSSPNQYKAQQLHFLQRQGLISFSSATTLWLKLSNANVDSFSLHMELMESIEIISQNLLYLFCSCMKLKIFINSFRPLWSQSYLTECFFNEFKFLN